MGRLPKVLLIDDCQDTGFLVDTSLKPYEVRQVVSIRDAKAALADGQFDLILLDVNLPDGDGFKFCRESAQDPRTKHIPFILLTSRNSPSDLAFGLNCGAEDYVKKPFNPIELKARVEARLRLFAADTTFIHGALEFDTEFLKCNLVQESGEKSDLQLTPTEFHILVSLVRSQGTALSRRELVDRVWKSQGTNIEARGVDTHIAHLRRKLGEHGEMIVSVYGKGYAIRRLE